MTKAELTSKVADLEFQLRLERSEKNTWCTAHSTVSRRYDQLKDAWEPVIEAVVQYFAWTESEPECECEDDDQLSLRYAVTCDLGKKKALADMEFHLHRANADYVGAGVEVHPVW